MKVITVGVLALQGSVFEHIRSTQKASLNLKLNVDVVSVRTKKDLRKLDALIIPGGESTTIYKLCQREGMFEKMKKIRNIFGTCAGAIMLAKIIQGKMIGQKTLELMDIEINRNAYGRQNDSFEKTIETDLGSIRAIFIRAPRIKNIGQNVKILAKADNEILACEQKSKDGYYLAACFHPELTSSKFHEYFLNHL